MLVEDVSSAADDVFVTLPHDWQELNSVLRRRDHLHAFGFANLTYSEASPSVSTLTLNALHFELAGHEWPRWRWKVELQANHQPQWVNAYVQYDAFRNNWITAGQFKLPFSHEIRTGSTTLETIDRPVSVYALSPGRSSHGNSHGVGVELAGDLLRSHKHLWLRYNAGVFNGHTFDTPGGARRREFVGRLKSQPLAGLILACDYARGSTPGSPVIQILTDAEIEYLHRRWKLQGEWLHGHEGQLHRVGGYGQVAYRFMRNWDAVVLVDHYRPDARTSAGQKDTWLAGVNWYITPVLRLQINQGVRRTLPVHAPAPYFRSQLQLRF